MGMTEPQAMATHGPIPARDTVTTTAPVSTAGLDGAGVLQIQAAMLSHRDLLSVAGALACELASRLGAQCVSVGLLDADTVTIKAMSASPDFHKKSQVCVVVAAAMDEAIEQGISIAYPQAPSARPRVTLAHAHMARHNHVAVLTVPLFASQVAVGAVCLEFPVDTQHGVEFVASLEHAAALIAPVLALQRDVNLSWRQRLKTGCVDQFNKLRGPGYVGLKAGVSLVVLGLLVLGVLPVTYRVSATSHLEGSIQRVLVAPADGFLRESRVKPGDTVTSGQTLVVLADQDLELERRKWISDVAQYENSYRTALAKGERMQFVVNSAKADAARAQLALVERLIERTQVKAPFDGLVIEGDLSQRLGAPLQRGEALLTLSPMDSYRLIVDVDERDIDAIKVGQSGALALAASPTSPLKFQVTRITPVAVVNGVQNVFEVEGKLEPSPLALRPGLQGVAKIEVGQRSLFWQWTHRLVDWVRLQWWWFIH